MTAAAPLIAPRPGLSPYGLLSVAFVLVLMLQLLRSMQIDAYGLSTTRIDLGGYVLALGVGLLLIARAIRSRFLMLDAVIVVTMLIAYVAFIIATTSLDSSIVDALLSRYGMLVWLVFGMGAGAASSFIAIPRGSPQSRFQRRLFVAACGLVALLLGAFSIGYIAAPVSTLNYQVVANNLYIMMILAMILIQTCWEGKVPVLLTAGVVVVGTTAVTAVALMQSTAIVGLWVASLAIFLWSGIMRLASIYKVLLVVALAAGATAYVQSEFFLDALQSTRLSEINSTGGFSSLDSRLSLLSDFGKQFAVSPVFGHFSAEIVAGSGLGAYVHSVPLSFLTHTGIVGTGMVAFALVLTLGRRASLSRLTPAETQQLAFFGTVLALGTIFAFLSWSVFWFMLGFMCKTPSLRRAGEAG